MQNHAKQFDADHQTIFEAIARWVKNYRESFGASRELAQCGPAEVAAMAQDLMISADDLRTLVHKSPDSARLLHRMLTALGVDERKLVARDPMVMRDLERLCVSCSHKRRCAHDLAAGTAAEHFREYCPNAYTLDMLFAEKKAAAPATSHG
jgi:hypothetical protein